MARTEATIAVTKPSMTKGYAIALTATTLWASTAIFISYLLTHYTIAPLTLACWRDVIVSSVLAVILAAVRPSLLRIRRQDIPFFAAYGFFGVAVFNALWVYSVDFNGATLAVVLVYTGPAFVAIAAHWLFHEPITRFKISAVASSLVGCVLVMGAYDLVQVRLNPLGILCGVGVGVGFAFYSLFGKLSASRYNPWMATAYSFGFGAFFLLLTQRPAQLISMGSAPLGWLTLFILGAGPTLGGFALYMASLRYLPVSVASLIATLEPVITAIMAFFLLGERLSTVQVVGSLLIILGVITGVSKSWGSERWLSSKAYRNQASGSTDNPLGLDTSLCSYSAGAGSDLFLTLPQLLYAPRHHLAARRIGVGVCLYQE